MRGARGGPGEFGQRAARAAQTEVTPANTVQIALLRGILGHQVRRAGDPFVEEAAGRAGSGVLTNRLTGRFPLLELEAAADSVAAEITAAVDALTGPGAPTPEPLAWSGRDLLDASQGERSALVAEWSRDTDVVDAGLGFWVRVAAAPIIELAAATIEPVARERWSKPACPACGASPQVSAIAEESGEFLAGSPRSLVCSRCASWWAFPRAVCLSCGEQDSRRMSAYHPEGKPGARIDVCETCRAYIKTFDLRAPGSRDVIPLVDDVATLTLDVWAQEQGLHHPALSLAGV